MNKKKRLAVVGCLHGNEAVGAQVIRQAADLLNKEGVEGIVAHPQALTRRIRFIDQDLNRSFPGRTDGNCEEKLAVHLLSELRSFAYVLDVHAFSCVSPPFMILTKRSPAHLDLAQSLGVQRLVLMSPQLASGRALIDYCTCGVSLEAGQQGLAATNKLALQAVKRAVLLASGRSVKQREITVFEIMAMLKKRGTETLLSQVQNFQLVAKGEVIARTSREVVRAPFDFYPVLAREQAYPHLLCLAARRVKI